MKNTLFSALFTLIALIAVAQPNILFEETFDGGIPNDWEASTGSPEGASWQWSASGRADTAWASGLPVPALFWNNRPSIASPSAANGAAMFNSDAFDSGGLSVGQGPFPGLHSGSLASPPINCEGEEIVYLKFNQYARANANAVSTRVEVSGDGGLSWTSFPFNRGVVENGSTPSNDVVILDISEVAGGQADVRLRFIWEGRYYFWLIDDIQLITPPEMELQFGEAYYPPSSFAQPAWQLPSDTFYFGARVRNLGYQPVSSLMLKASIFRIQSSSTTLAYSDSLVISGFPPLAKDSSLFLDTPYLPQLAEGEYRLCYELSAIGQADFNPADNVLQFPFRVSSRQFAKEDDIDIGARPLAGGDYQVANYYHISPLAGDNFFVDKVTFAAGVNPDEGALAGKQASLRLYKVKETVSPDFGNFDVYSDESLELLGWSDYTFSSSDLNFGLKSLPLETQSGGPVVLEPDGRYFLASVFTGPSNNRLLQAFNDDIDYFQVSTVVFNGEWYLDGFGPGLAAVLRMEVGLMATQVKAVLPEEGLVLFPNPAREVLNVAVRLEKPSPAMLAIANSEGQVLRLMEYENLYEEQLSLNLGGFPAGSYLLRLSTESGARTVPFVVVR